MNIEKSVKLTYIKPQADIIDIQFPDVICEQSCIGPVGKNSANDSEACGAEYDEGNSANSNEYFLNSVSK